MTNSKKDIWVAHSIYITHSTYWVNIELFSILLLETRVIYMTPTQTMQFFWLQVTLLHICVNFDTFPAECFM